MKPGGSEAQTPTLAVALAHDYATQRGGAERVALWLAQAFPDAPMYTTLYDPEGTFPEFAALDLRTTPLNRIGLLRRYHRLSLPLLAPALMTQRVESDVLLASSTGWAHGYRGAGRTVVYCHAPARWLYQRDRYLGPTSPPGANAKVRRLAAAAALGLLSPPLRRWDRRAAARADVYLANSTVTQRAIREVYDIDAEVLPPPPAMLPDGQEQPVPGLTPGYLLCIARLLPYKNVDLLIRAAAARGAEEVVVVGDGPDRGRLEALARQTGRARLLGRVHDDELRWLYRNASMLVAASYEDYGLSPLEAGAFGRPSVVLRDGGYLDTVRDGVTGTFFDAPEVDLVARAIDEAAGRCWDDDVLKAHVESFSLQRFVARLQDVVSQVQQPGSGRPIHDVAPRGDDDHP